MAAMPGRLHGHYPDLATCRRSRGRHSDIGGRRRPAKRAFLAEFRDSEIPKQITQTHRPQTLHHCTMHPHASCLRIALTLRSWLLEISDKVVSER
jgi:hypothetical protein